MRRLMQHLLSRVIVYGATLRYAGTLLDRVESPTKRAFHNYSNPLDNHSRHDGHVDSIRHFLFTDNFTKPYSHEYFFSPHLNHCPLIYFVSFN